MNLTRFSRVATLALYLVSSGFLSAASQSDESNDLPLIRDSQTVQRSLLIACNEPTQQPIPGVENLCLTHNQVPVQLLARLMQQRDEALTIVTQLDRQIMARLNSLVTSPPNTQGLQDFSILPNQAIEPSSIPIQASVSIQVPRPVVSDIVIPEIARGYEDIYRRFVMGKLIYKPDPKSDTGKIELPIRSLVNPLEGTFDLSRCGNTGQYLSIATGYRKGQKAENASKVEIWITPQFLVERELSSTARHLQPIMGNWDEAKAPVGLLWTWGGWDNLGWYDYLVTDSMEGLGSENLYEKWNGARHDSPWWPAYVGGLGLRVDILPHFMFHL